jgi:hypothetical protein
MVQADTREAASAARLDRVFFTAAATVLAAIVFAGFAPTFYMAAADAPALTAAARLHGIAGSAWVALFALQPWLIAGGRVALHRSLGRAGPFVAAAFVLSGIAVVAGLERSHAGEPVLWLAAHVFANGAPLAAFASCVALGFRARNRDLASHKRWMWFASAVLLPAAFGRLFGRLGIGEWSAPVYVAYTLLVVGYDALTRGRVPRASWAGAAALIAIEVTTDAWLAAL